MTVVARAAIAAIAIATAAATIAAASISASAAIAAAASSPSDSLHSGVRLYGHQTTNCCIAQNICDSSRVA